MLYTLHFRQLSRNSTLFNSSACRVRSLSLICAHKGLLEVFIIICVGIVFVGQKAGRILDKQPASLIRNPPPPPLRDFPEKYEISNLASRKPQCFTVFDPTAASRRICIHRKLSALKNNYNEPFFSSLVSDRGKKDDKLSFSLIRALLCLEK